MKLVYHQNEDIKQIICSDSFQFDTIKLRKNILLTFICITYILQPLSSNSKITRFGESSRTQSKGRRTGVRCLCINISETEQVAQITIICFDAFE